MLGRATPMEVPSAPALLEAMSEAVYAVDRDRRITYWNSAAEQLTGFSAAEVVGHRCQDNLLNHVDDTGRELCKAGCPLSGTISDGQTREVRVFLRHRAGHRVPVAVRAAALRGADGTVTGAVEVFHDDSTLREVTDRLDVVEMEALTDPLTGIANRRMLERALDLRQDEYKRYGRGYAVLFGDVDDFKQVNDRYGYVVGDRVLKLVATTLHNSTRPSDTAGRWGGDKFVILVPVADQHQAVALADRTRHLVAGASAVHDRRRVAVTLTVGVALAHPDEPVEELVNRSCVAMRSAKDGGGNRTLVG